MASKKKAVEEHHKELEHHHDEHHKKEKRSIGLTLFFIFLMVVGCVMILMGFGIIDVSSGESMERADTICFLSGYAGGVAEDSIQRNGTSYIFECDKSVNATIEFDREMGKGVINWKK